MGYRNPLTSLPADHVTSGNLSGTYQLTGQILAGAPAGSHVAISPTGLVFYASDGVTPLIQLDTSDGAGTITSATIQTASSGNRLVLTGGSSKDVLSGYTGGTGEVTPGLLQMDVTSGARGPGGVAPLQGGLTQIIAPDFGQSGSSLASVLCMSKDVNGNGVNGVGVTGDFFQAKGSILDPNGHPLPRWATGTQRTIDAFGSNGTTDSTGHLTIAHSLGVVPISLIVCALGTNLTGYRIISVSNTNFTVQAMNGTATVNSAAVLYYYLAIG